MTHSPNHVQFTVDAYLQNHLIENGDTLSELLLCICDVEAMVKLTKLLSGNVCCAVCQNAHVRHVRDCLAGALHVQDADRPDFDAAVRWHGARLDEMCRRTTFQNLSGENF